MPNDPRMLATMPPGQFGSPVPMPRPLMPGGFGAPVPMPQMGAGPSMDPRMIAMIQALRGGAQPAQTLPNEGPRLPIDPRENWDWSGGAAGADIRQQMFDAIRQRGGQ